MFSLRLRLLQAVPALIGVSLVAFVLLRWRRSSSEVAPVTAAPTSNMNAEQRQRLERELADLDRRA